MKGRWGRIAGGFLVTAALVGGALAWSSAQHGAPRTHLAAGPPVADATVDQPSEPLATTTTTEPATPTTTKLASAPRVTTTTDAPAPVTTTTVHRRVATLPPQTTATTQSIYDSHPPPTTCTATPSTTTPKYDENVNVDIRLSRGQQGDVSVAYHDPRGLATYAYGPTDPNDQTHAVVVVDASPSWQANTSDGGYTFQVMTAANDDTCRFTLYPHT